MLNISVMSKGLAFHKPIIAPSFGLILVSVFLSGCAHPLERQWRKYREAKEKGDYATAAKYLAPNARIWFDQKQGPGEPLGAEGGPYKDWDREFRSTSTYSEVEVKGKTVTYVSQEINDFFRFIERTPTKARVTYYFDDSGIITGLLYEGMDSDGTSRPPDRFDEFKKWADQRYPGLIDSDEMKIPNHPRRWRELLTKWRSDTGLPPIK